MTTVTFDTHKFIKKVSTDKAFTTKQAEALAEAFKIAQAEIEEHASKTLATKIDIKQLEIRITRMMMTQTAITVAILATLIKFL